MTYRCARMIEILLNGNPKTVAQLSARLNVSERLVRYDIVRANEFLQNQGMPQLEMRRGAGISIRATPAQREELTRLLRELDAYECYPHPSQRKDYILMTLLAADGYLTGRYLADLLQVSKSSIDKDLSAIRSELPFGLVLEGRTGRGIRVTGDERQLRNTALGLLVRHARFQELVEERDSDGNHVDRAVRALAPPDLVAAARRAAEALETGKGEKLTFSSYRELVLYLAVILERVRRGCGLELDESELGLLRASPEYAFAAMLAALLERHTGVELSYSETGLIASLLLGCQYAAHADRQTESWAQAQVASDLLVKGMERALGFPFSEDVELYRALQQHLGPGLVRLKNRIPVTNPELDTIKQSYAEVYGALAELIEGGDQELFRGMGEDEIGYVALHFCASMERGRRGRSVCNIVIVCTHGAGTGYLIKETLCARFSNLRVLEVTTRADLDKKYGVEIDFIVSSVPVEHPSVPVVEVGSIPTEADFIQVAAAIDRAALARTDGGRADSALALFKDVVAAVQDSLQTDNTQELIGPLLDVFTAHGLPLRLDHVQPGLSELLPAESIQIGAQANNWAAAVQLAGSLITRTGAAGGPFIDSMLRTVEEMGPYIVIAPGIALPHSKAGEGVRRLAMSLVALKEPVRFFHPVNDPVRLLLCLAPVDNYSHLQALSDFLELLRNGGLEEILRAESVEQVLKILGRTDAPRM